MEVNIDKKMPRGENSDRISNLPDSLLIDILSLMNARDVVQTCILSKRWRNLWAFVPSLHFDSTEFGGNAERFNNFVGSFLRFRDEASNLHTFTLSYSVPLDAEISDLVSMWILYALNHKVKDLVVDLLGKHFQYVPNCLFTCDSLEYMHLRGWVFNELDIVCFPKLRRLSLYGVFMQFDSMQKLLSGCPALETLSMHRCGMHMDTISFQTVKSLTIKECGFFSLSDSPTFSISAPCLEYIEFVKCHGRGITFKDMSKVIEANFMMPKVDEKDYDFNLFSGISGVKSLYLGCVHLKELLNGEVKKCRTFHKLKYLGMGFCCMHHDFGFCSSFLKHCPNLEYLCLVHTEAFCEEDHSAEVNSENPKKIEGFYCQNLKEVQIQCLSYDRVHPIEQVVLQMTEKMHGVEIIVSEHRSKSRSPL